jgi:TDG/mug DNA glycosylase family protein
MVQVAAEDHPGVPAIQADLTDLPFERGAVAAGWAAKAHHHQSAAQQPQAQAALPPLRAPGGRLALTMFTDPPSVDADPAVETVTTPDQDDLPGRCFTYWNPDRLAAVVAGAGFGVDRLVLGEPGVGEARTIEIEATRAHALPDHVGPRMRLLCCGLNPSVHAANAGVGYVTRSNRFWPALREAGLTRFDRDARRLLRHDRIGMTDLVKRPTPRAADVTTAEFREGTARLAELCRWLDPAAVVVVGLAGWRAGRDRRAEVGWQPEPLGPTPVYVMPSTSGLNARVPLAELAHHLRTAADGR